MEYLGNDRKMLFVFIVVALSAIFASYNYAAVVTPSITQRDVLATEQVVAEAGITLNTLDEYGYAVINMLWETSWTSFELNASSPVNVTVCHGIVFDGSDYSPDNTGIYNRYFNVDSIENVVYEARGFIIIQSNVTTVDINIWFEYLVDYVVYGEYYEVIDERGIQDLFFGLLGLVVFPLVTVTALSLVVFIEN
jgi:hypothetical protein